MPLMCPGSELSDGLEPHALFLAPRLVDCRLWEVMPAWEVYPGWCRQGGTRRYYTGYYPADPSEAYLMEYEI